MKNIFTKCLRFAPIVMLSLMMSSCLDDEHFNLPNDNPKEDEVENTNVALNLNLKFTVPISERGTLSRVPSEGEYKQRFIVAVYRNRQVVAQQTEIKDVVTDADASVPVSLEVPAKECQIVVWSDFVKADNADLYYNTTNLIPIVPQNDTYVGNVEYKDAYSASTEIDLTSYSGQKDVSVTKDIQLTRPLARYSLTATDVAAFLRRVAAGKVSGNTFTARITYTSYLSVGYNAYDDVPKQSLKDVSYTSSFALPESGTTELNLAFDYVFVNSGETSQIPMTIEILDEKNQVIATTSVRVTCERDKQTTVRGRFLTTDANGGVNIDPDYDGKISVDLGTL